METLEFIGVFLLCFAFAYVVGMSALFFLVKYFFKEEDENEIPEKLKRFKQKRFKQRALS